MNTQSLPKPGQPCPCGSGKKYRDCCATADAAARARRKKVARQAKRLVIWIGVIAVVGAAGYGLSRSSGVPFDEDDIRVVDFSDLNDAQRRTALQAANSARCPCGCGMNLAQCVATDSTCPLRETNIGKIRTLVEQAKGS